MARSRLPAGILQDLRSSLRSLSRSWGLIGVAVFSLAVGIGANTAVFSAVDVFMLRPLPYPDSERLHMVWITNQERGVGQVTFSAPDFRDLRERSRTMRLAASCSPSRPSSRAWAACWASGWPWGASGVSCRSCRPGFHAWRTS